MREGVLVETSALEKAERECAEEADDSGRLDARALHSRGIHLAGAHLIASCLLTPGTQLWRRDAALERVAGSLGVFVMLT